MRFMPFREQEREWRTESPTLEELATPERPALIPAGRTRRRGADCGGPCHGLLTVHRRRRGTSRGRINHRRAGGESEQRQSGKEWQ